MRVPTTFFLLFATLLLPASAHAQLFRAYLSGSGSDANPCTLQAPCRLLPAALNAVAGGGEIWMLNSANYNTGAVIVGKSVSILTVPGAVGSLVVTNGAPAISVTADGLTVALRNLVIGPVATQPAGTHGVHLTGNSTVLIEASVIFNLSGGDAIRVDGPGRLRLTDSVIRRAGAVLLRNGATATISGSSLINVTDGLHVVGAAAGTVTSATVTDSLFSASVVWAETTANATARIAVTRSTVERNQYGLVAETNDNGTATVSISGSTINANSFGWDQVGAGSSIVSLGNNHFYNTANNGSLTPAALQ